MDRHCDAIHNGGVERSRALIWTFYDFGHVIGHMMGRPQTIILSSVRVCRRPPGEISHRKLNMGFQIAHFVSNTNQNRRGT